MIRAHLYDADGHDREVALTDVRVGRLGAHQLLWVDAAAPTGDEISDIGRAFELRYDSLAALTRASRRPRLDSYGTYLQFDVGTIVERGDMAKARETPVDATSPAPRAAATGDQRLPAATVAPLRWDRLHLICGDRFVITVHERPLAFLDVFQRQDKGETRIGDLNGAALAASLLDMHLGTFFDAIERIEHAADELDDAVLARSGARGTLHTLAALRGEVADLRRLLALQREVVYGLSQPKFAALTGETAAPYLRTLNERFNRAIDAAESARALLLGSFELFATRTALETNDLVKILTFVTALLGALGVIAGVFGMNFPLGMFERRSPAFAAVLAGMGGLVLLAILVAWRRRWLTPQFGPEPPGEGERGPSPDER